MSVVISDLPNVALLTGDEQVLVVSGGQAVLVSVAVAAQAPQALAVSAGDSLLDQAKGLKRKALTATAGRMRSHASTGYASVLAGMPGALQNTAVADEFNTRIADIEARLAARLTLVDAATSIAEVDDILW